MGLSNARLLALASEFDLGPEPLVNGRWRWWLEYTEEANWRRVYCRLMPGAGGARRWSLRTHERSCLNKLGQWEDEPYGERDGAFFARCRWDTARQAIAFYRRYLRALGAWARAQQRRGVTVLNYNDFALEDTDDG